MQTRGIVSCFQSGEVKQQMDGPITIGLNIWFAIEKKKKIIKYIYFKKRRSNLRLLLRARGVTFDYEWYALLKRSEKDYVIF